LAAETGHIWPGSEFGERLGSTTEAIGATDLIWAFFTQHLLPYIYIL
jgi:poly(3-hydroxybutyrate) depolymerase